MTRCTDCIHASVCKFKSVHEQQVDAIANLMNESATIIQVPLNCGFFKSLENIEKNEHQVLIGC